MHTSNMTTHTQGAMRTGLSFIVTLALFLGSAWPADAQDNTKALPSPPSPSVSQRPTLFVVGDSTAANSQDLGWGSHLGRYFDAAKINILNRARGGRSSRTFQLEGLWDKVLAEVKAGDFVLIQFGHNDGGTPTGTPGRGSLKGLGEEIHEITNNSGQQETVHTFCWYMRKYAADTRAKGATPVILSLTVRNEWREGKVERGPGQYSKWSEEVAKSQGAPFVDLNNIVGALYEKLGPEKVKEFFPRDHTHTSADGANLNARSVVSGLKGLSEGPLNGYLSDAGKAVESHSSEPARQPDAAQPVGRRERGAQSSSTPRVGPVHPGFNPALPTLWIIGDSTVKNGRDDGAGGLWGWGNPIAAAFDKTKINDRNTNTETGQAPQPQLYNLAEDQGESKDIAAQNPEKVQELQMLLESVRANSRSRR